MTSVGYTLTNNKISEATRYKAMGQTQQMTHDDAPLTFGSLRSPLTSRLDKDFGPLPPIVLRIINLV